MTFEIIIGDCLDVMRGWETGSVDLVMCSPPYEDARTYGIDFALRGQDWVDWAKERFLECLRICRGLVCWVVEGKTNDFQWSATPALLLADLHRAGVNLRKPPIYHRSGIPGSGGPDWFRNDYEFCICATKGGKLPWSDNVALGHKPRWAPGGKLSYRNAEGQRRHKMRGTSGYRNGDATYHSVDGKLLDRAVTEVANPGNVIYCDNGGGRLGDYRAHENEAPYSEKLVEFFIRSCCRPEGIVCDPFSGSGTTGDVALQFDRNFIGIDIRDSQVELTKRRLAEVQRQLFA